MENIVITGTDNTTQLTFLAVTGSGGEGKPAVWRLPAAAGAPIAAAELLEVSARFNGTKTVRRVTVSLLIPLTETNSATGKTTVTDRIPVELTLPVLQGANPAVAEMVANRISKIASNAVIVSQLASGYARV